MERREFGRTGIAVSLLGLGGSQIGQWRTTQREADDILGAALSVGINVIDTAECYGDSEEKIGRALGGRRNEYYLFTKCGHARGAWHRARFAEWDPALLTSTIDRSLKRLRTDYLDLVQLHGCPEETLRKGNVIEALERAKQAGKTRFIGYSGDNEAALHAVRCGAFDALQISVNLADQDAIDRVLPTALERGIGVIAKRPLAHISWLTGYVEAYWKRFTILDYEFLKLEPEKAVSFALRFTLSCPGVHSAIVGISKTQRIAQNAKSLEGGPLTPEEFSAIRERWSRVAKPDWVGQM